MEKNILTLLTPKTQTVYINANMTIRQGLEKLRVHGFSAIPVINDDGTYVGVVSEGDFLWRIMDNNVVNAKELEETKIKDIIRKKVPCCKINVSFDDLVKLVANFNFVPIIDDRGILMGIITRASVIRKLY